MQIKFKCPSCGETYLEEVRTNVTVIARVEEEAELAEKGQIALNYDEDFHKGGCIHSFQCENCQEFIAGSNRELLAYLRANDMVELEDGEQFDD